MMFHLCLANFVRAENVLQFVLKQLYSVQDRYNLSSFPLLTRVFSDQICKVEIMCVYVCNNYSTRERIFITISVKKTRSVNFAFKILIL